MAIKNVTVFAVGNEYQIMAQANGCTLMTVRVGDRIFGDESNGILRSNVKIHRVAVPMKLLDEAGEYTVIEQQVTERRPYFPKLGEIDEETYKFYPVPKTGEVRAYHVADAHNRVETPVGAAKKFGKIDFLVMNGDIPEDCSSESNFDTVYNISHGITGGNIPVVFSRGNHDMRGILAEQIIDFTPNQNGNSYYSFRIGSVWGVVLDCGEDKDDDHPEYNHTVCCGNFRRRQTEYLESIVKHADSEYAAKGVEHRIVVVHNPFPCIHRMDPPFLNETDRYAEWTKILGDSIKPDVMLAGHYHRLEVARDGDNPRDGHLPFTVLFGAQPTDDDFAGCGLVFRADSRTVDVTFTNNTDGVIGTDTIVP